MTVLVNNRLGDVALAMHNTGIALAEHNIDTLQHETALAMALLFVASQTASMAEWQLLSCSLQQTVCLSKHL